MARMSLDELRNRASTVDRAKLDATTEADIEAHRAADGDADLDVAVDGNTVESPRALRVRLGMTQPEMATALRVPLGTWRNWEQERVNLEPAVLALLRVVSHNPAIAFAALAPEVRSVYLGLLHTGKLDPVVETGALDRSGVIFGNGTVVVAAAGNEGAPMSVTRLGSPGAFAGPGVLVERFDGPDPGREAMPPDKSKRT